MSKYKIKESVMEKISDLLFQVLGRDNNKDIFISSLNDILSPVERLMVGKRILIMYMIYSGINYDVICNIVKVSRATIAKFAFLLDKSTTIKRALLAISTKSKIKLTIDELISTFNEPGLSLGSWKSAQKLKRRILEQKEQGF